MGDKKLPGIAAAILALRMRHLQRACVNQEDRGLAGNIGLGRRWLPRSAKPWARGRYSVPPGFFAASDSRADDLGNMFQFKHDFEPYFCGAMIGICRSLSHL
jgi:hypothetical protein